MTAPNVQITPLTKFMTDNTPDQLMYSMPANIAGAAGNQTIAANSGIIGGVLSHTPTANVTLTLDTAANFVNQLMGTANITVANANQTINPYGPLPVGAYFEFTIVNLGSTANTADTLAGGTGVTLVGNATIPLSTSASFRMVVSGNATFNCFRK